MNQKKLINLTLILVIGLVLVVVQNLWSKYQQKQPNDYLKAIKEIDASLVSEVTLSKGNQQLQFTKTNNGWKVASKSADKTKVSELINGLLPSESPVLIAQSPEKLKDLNVTEDTATKVSLKINDKTSEFLVGKRIGSLTSVALRNQSLAYNLRNIPTLSLEPNSWYDLTIVDIESEAIKSFSVQSGISIYTLTQIQDREWRFEGKENEVNHEAVNTYVMRLNPFKAKELAFEDKQRQYSQISPSFTLLLTDKNDQKTVLEFFKGKNDYLVKRSGDEEYFIVSTFDAESINEKAEKFTLSSPQPEE
ncbi:MAG: DUF4340 domain-containing protein [Patescibacteria group bacterium]|jgi:hypothetical protein